ncbi:single-stranded-DNA-specific exonuclease RecJ [candidate division KSB1 bacterium]|nr:single-stranded-DNA-specific exonuclease RecJ [candidate division KSB1 bacterium]
MNLKWVFINEYSNEEVKRLSSELNVPPIISKILLSRGVNDLEGARKFFRAKISHLYDPFLMKDMTVAVERLRKAVLSSEKILIYGDYDVDGITSVSFLYLLLKELAVDVSYYIPDRQVEGYGLSDAGIEDAYGRGVSLIITTDCGITGHPEIEHANSLGIDVIISDHHEPGLTLPKAVAVIDPKREDCLYPFKELAGVGVAYKLAQGLLSRMDIDVSILEKYLDLVAIGTAADIVPLIDENRIFVKAGLERLNDSENLGLSTLIQTAGLGGCEIGTGQIVFIIAPRINAVGRMGDAKRAVELLTTDQPERALEIADILEKENHSRKNVDEQTFLEALNYVERIFDPQTTHSLVLHQEGWHTGVIGIVASRVVERYYRPTILISVENGVGKGSARSIQDFDIYEAIKSLEYLLIAYGGHKYAAGLSIDEKNIPIFAEKFEHIVRERTQPDMLVPKLKIDAPIRLSQIDAKFIKLLKMFAPFGPQNMKPVFVSKGVQVLGSPTIVGRNHLKFKVKQDGRIFDAIGFNMGEMLYRLVPGEANLDIAYVVDENEYMGRKSIQLRAKDLR